MKIHIENERKIMLVNFSYILEIIYLYAFMFYYFIILKNIILFYIYYLHIYYYKFFLICIMLFYLFFYKFKLYSINRQLVSSLFLYLRSQASIPHLDGRRITH